MKPSVHARVVVTLEIPVRSAWGEECSFEQIKKQALKDALDAVERIHGDRHDQRYTIVGQPKVTMLLATDETP